MRKIELDMLAAIRARKNWSRGNTCVSAVGDAVAVFLHGHRIAFFDGGPWEISLCGWNTMTTRSRLSAIVRDVSANGGAGLGVSTKRGKVFLRDARGSTEIDEDGKHHVRCSPVAR